MKIWGAGCAGVCRPRVGVAGNGGVEETLDCRRRVGATGNGAGDGSVGVDAAWRVLGVRMCVGVNVSVCLVRDSRGRLLGVTCCGVMDCVVACAALGRGVRNASWETSDVVESPSEWS